MDIQNISLAIVSLINLFWGLVVLLQRPIKKYNIAFGAMVFSAVAWLTVIILFRLSVVEAQALIMAKVFYALAVLIPLFFLYFTFLFPEKRKIFDWLFAILISVPALMVFVVTLFSDMIIIGVNIVSGYESTIIFGNQFIFYALCVNFYFIWTLVNLFINIFRYRGILSTQFKYIFAGLLMSSSIALVTDLFLPWMGIFEFAWVGQASTVVWISLTSYALMRYFLTNKKVIMTELFSGLIIVVSLIYIFESKNALESVTRIFVFIITIIFSALLIKSVIREVDRREKIEKLANELKRKTIELRKANDELKRLDNAKSEFLSIASHQLRTPLTVVKGYVSMMLEGNFGKLPKLVRQHLEKVFISTEKLIGLVESLLNISRIESGRIEFNIKPIDLALVVTTALDRFQSIAKEKKIILELSIDKNLPKVSADLVKAEDVISHIIDNAIKYTTSGSIKINLSKKDKMLIFSCQDTGIGILAKDLPRLFEKFSGGKGMMEVYSETTGLGMYFTRMLIEKMGGQIWAESAGKDKGSKFLFSLPVWEDGVVKVKK